MNNLLPIYYKNTLIDPLKKGNNNGHQFGIYINESNNIPTFVTELRECDTVPTVTSFIVRKCNTNLLNSDVLTYSDSFSQSTAILTVHSEIKNGKYFYKVANENIFPIDNLTTGKGIYQLYIAMSNGDYYNSDLLAFLGVPFPTYVCSNAAFSVPTNTFTLDIDRTDIDITANSESVVIIKCYNSDTQEYVYSKSFVVNHDVGDPTGTISMSVVGVQNPFDFVIWSGACSGSLEITLFQFEDGRTSQLEGNYFIITD